jgi:hypothetical protein
LLSLKSEDVPPEQFAPLAIRQAFHHPVNHRQESASLPRHRLRQPSTALKKLHHHTEANLGEGLTVRKQRVKESAERQAYDASDIMRLLSSPIYTTALPTKQPERYWLPLILLLSGTLALASQCPSYLLARIATL